MRAIELSQDIEEEVYGEEMRKAWKGLVENGYIDLNKSSSLGTASSHKPITERPKFMSNKNTSGWGMEDNEGNSERERQSKLINHG